MNKKICIVTATRAEFGLLKSVVAKLKATRGMEVELVVTGMHLSPEFGSTYREIEKDGIPIAEKIPILMGGDSPADISKTMGIAMISFADYFDRSCPDLLVVLGDRFETLAVACAAHNARIPIAHLYGGETTAGAVDEAFRHAITKMSALHFTSTESYRKRVIQLGEQPDTVFNVGAIGVENALCAPLLHKAELQKEIGFDLSKRYAVGTFHPVTLENCSAQAQVQALIRAIDTRNDLNYIFTKANSDANGRVINAELENYANGHRHVKFVSSLGMIRYLSAIKYSEFVIGNSSSGLIEVPSLKVPTIDIGDRQKGRVAASGVIHCQPDTESILAAMEKALSKDFAALAADAKNPYEKSGTTDTIVKIITETLQHPISLKKSFYDLPNVAR